MIVCVANLPSSVVCLLNVSNSQDSVNDKTQTPCCLWYIWFILSELGPFSGFRQMRCVLYNLLWHLLCILSSFICGQVCWTDWYVPCLTAKMNFEVNISTTSLFHFPLKVWLRQMRGALGSGPARPCSSYALTRPSSGLSGEESLVAMTPLRSRNLHMASYMISITTKTTGLDSIHLWAFPP